MQERECSELDKDSVDRILDILLSHVHLDHVVGLSFVLGWRRLNGLESIHVYGEGRRFAQIQEHIFRIIYFLSYRPLSGVNSLLSMQS
jgi:ribonuclease BN (tRNA processing enzyme)